MSVNLEPYKKISNSLGQEKIPNIFIKEKENYWIINSFFALFLKKCRSLVEIHQLRSGNHTLDWLRQQSAKTT